MSSHSLDKENQPWLAALDWRIPVLTLLLLVLLVMGFGFLPSGQSNFSSPSSQFPRPRELQIENGISFDGYPVKQSILLTKSGRILVQHYPKELVPLPRFSIETDEIAEPYFVKDRSWFEGFENGEFLTTFNCVTFAFGDDIGLTPSDHLDPIPQQGFSNPLKIILEEYYHRIESFETDFERFTQIAVEGDIICFYSSDGLNEHCIHVARVTQEDTSKFILSKMGRRGPILRTNIRFLLRHYDKTNRIVVFRLKINDT